MMKFVVSSDWHGDWVTHGVHRFADVRDAVHAVADRAIEESAQFVFAGDLANPDSGSCTFRVVHLAIEVALRLAARNLDSFWIAGNHDVIEDGSGETTLRPLKALEITGKVHVFEAPGVATVRALVDQDEYREVSVIGIPFTATSHSYDPAVEISRLTENLSPRNVMIVGHLHVPGVEPGEETTEMPRGREVWLPAKLACERAKVVINGHYHRQQRSPDGVWIPGSLARLTFCEEKNDPGFLLVGV